MDGNNPNQKRVHKGKDSQASQIKARSDFVTQARVKAASYCAYQERTQQEVRDKLYDLGLHRDEVEEALTVLITENFVNEERFARSFARGKFRHNKWGRLKIRQALQHKGLSGYCQEVALEEIEDEDYRSQLKALIEKKLTTLEESDAWKRKNKVARFVMGKGYESELAWNLINELVDDENSRN